MADSDTLTDAVEELSASFLGKYGIVMISDVHDGEPTIEVHVNGSTQQARQRLPKRFHGYPVLLREAGRIVAH